jgi:hypothetical protein
MARRVAEATRSGMTERARSSSPRPYFPRSIAVGQFNGDNDPDLAVANQGSDNVSVLLGGAGSSFTGPKSFRPGYGPESVAVGDFDRNSDPDLAVVNFESDSLTVMLAVGAP